MVVGVLGKLSCAQQFVVLQRLPSVLHRIERRVENDAVRVQMRIERARRVMCEQGRGKIAGEPVALRSTDPNRALT